MKLEVGMYVRFNNGDIGKIANYEYREEYTNGYVIYLEKDETIGWCCEEKDFKASYNIIDLIEVGDYVNGYKVSFIGNDYKPFVQCDYPVQEGTTNHYRFYEEAIYSIVTKQQFSQMEYKVGE